jgi:hypothetical protein
MKTHLLILILALFISAPVYARDEPCVVEGEIVEMGVGYSKSLAPDGNGGTREMQISYTLVSVQLAETQGQNGSCAKKSKNEVRNYGLCEDINVYQGDVLRAKTGTWNYGGECLWAVDVLKRTWKPESE